VSGVAIGRSAYFTRSRVLLPGRTAWWRVQAPAKYWSHRHAHETRRGLVSAAGLEQNASVDSLAAITGFAVDAVDAPLGRIANVRRDGPPLLVIQDAWGRERLLPADVIEDIDATAKRIRVYRSTREIDAAPSARAALERHYAPWGAGHRVLPAQRPLQLITHIADRTGWEAAAEPGVYRPASLAGDGFVHCSTAYSVCMPANLFFRGRQGLVLLAIDQRLLDSEIRWEEPQPTVEAFPHIYGPVNLDAVVAVERFDAGKDGDFEVPNAIRRLADEYAARA